MENSVVGWESVSAGGRQLSLIVMPTPDWQLLAAEEPPRWAGDLDDDCTARWAGLTLRAECMDTDDWWWCVYDDSSGNQVASSNEDDHHYSTGATAREAAEQAARIWLGLK